VFGLFAHVADFSLHEIVARDTWRLTFDGWTVGMAVLTIAGQF